MLDTDVRMELLLPFHGLGRGATGIIACGAVVYTSERLENRSETITVPVPLSEPFYSATHSEQIDSSLPRFEQWLDKVLIEGLKYWQQVIA